MKSPVTRLYLRGREEPFYVVGGPAEVLAALRSIGEEPTPFVELEVAYPVSGGHTGSTVRINPFAVDAVSEVKGSDAGE